MVPYSIVPGRGLGMRLGTVHNYTISYALIDHCFARGKSKSLALADDAKTGEHTNQLQ